MFLLEVNTLCLAHILNLVGEVFSHVTKLITFIKLTFKKKKKKKKNNSWKKQYFFKWLESSLPKEQVKLPCASGN